MQEETGPQQKKRPEPHQPRFPKWFLGSLKWFLNLDLYKKCGPYAKNVKILLQMGIGGVISILAIVKLVQGLENPTTILTLTEQILGIVSIALVISTVFELAYTLFTDDLDEAINPVITALAATILLIISKITMITYEVAIGVATLVLALVILFILRYFFLMRKDCNVSCMAGLNIINSLLRQQVLILSFHSNLQKARKQKRVLALPNHVGLKVFGMGWSSTGQTVSYRIGCIHQNLFLLS